MEREVYGQEFRHDGAPDGLVDACEKRYPEPGAFGTLHKLRKERLARSGLCDAGNHVYSYSEPGCVMCERAGDYQG
jgi:hypothetical protein